jgi:hypothetical protein
LGNYRHYQGGREAGWKRVDAVLANHPDLKSVRLLMKARFHLDHGWEVRGNEFANAVPDEAIDVFHRQLELAGDAAAEAWRLDPTDPHGPMILIEVCKGLGLPRPTMELWFRRAMRADGDNLSACLSKLDYLEPKWHGSEKEMFEFARQCFATQNWEGGLPFALIQAHRSTATCRRADKGEYYKQPEVWKDIKAVCEGHLAASGHSRHELCVYASWAHECSDFATADKLFDEIGDRFSPDVFGKEEYQAMRDDSKKQAQGK